MGNTGHSVNYTPGSWWVKVLSEGVLAEDESRAGVDQAQLLMVKT